MPKQKVYTFKGRSEKGAKYVKISVIAFNLEQAKIQAKKKHGKQPILSTGKHSKKLTSLLFKTRLQR